MDNGRTDDPADRALAALVRQHVSRPAAPPALRARVERALAEEIRAPQGRALPAPARRPLAPALAAGLAGLLLVAGAAGLWLGVPAAERRLAADAARAAHAEYERLEASGPTERATDPAVVAARLTDILGVTVRMAAPAGGRVRLTGIAPSALLGGKGVAVFFEVDGNLATLSLVPAAQRFPRENRVRLARGRPYVTAVGKTRFVLWRQGPLVCALAGHLSEPRLTAVFLAIRPGLQVGS